MATIREPLTPNQRRSIGSDLQTLRGQLLETVRQTPLSLNMESLWKSLVSTRDMALSLGKSEELVYLGIYYAYEIFLTQCVGAKLGQSDYRWSRVSDFEKDIVRAFGVSVCDFGWRANEIKMARLVRNVIVHNGNKMTNQLEPFRMLLNVHDEHISIAADETTQLAATLKDKASRVLTDIISRA